LICEPENRLALIYLMSDVLITVLLDEVERLKAIIEEQAALPTREAGSGKPIQSRFSIQNSSDAVSPSWSVSGWFASMGGIVDIMATEVTKGRPAQTDEAQWIKGMCERDIASALNVALPAVKEHVLTEFRKLGQQEHLDAQKLNEKFLADSSCFEFKYGGMDDYHGGLERLIGQPYLNLRERMEWEHTLSPYANAHFWWSFGETTAAHEWEYVVDYQGTVETADKGRNGALLADLFAVNATQIEEAGLQDVEVIALRLYTGPIYVWYNNVLRYIRDKSTDLFDWAPSHIREWKEKGWNNVFTTTLHVLNSAIIKLSKNTKAVKVYRGLQGGVLPEKFWTPNASGVRGGIEMGFMSTTTKREVALGFAASSQDQKADEVQPASVLLEIQMGMVDRGASVQWCSQFPAEEEVLFAPLTGQEVMGHPKIEGRTLVVELRLNCNLHDLCIEQVTAKMKTTHLELVHTIMTDMQMLGFPYSSLGPLIEHQEEYTKKDGLWFNNANSYKRATNDALQTKLQVCSKTLVSADSCENTSLANTAADILFEPGDSDALAEGVASVLLHNDLLVTYGERLAQVAACAHNYDSEFRLELPNRNIVGELPEAVLLLLVSAKSFNLAGNSFSNIVAGSALYDMVYTMRRWHDATFDWRGKHLGGFDCIAKFLHTGSFIADEMSTSVAIQDLRGTSGPTNLSLAGRGIGADGATIIASLLPLNSVLTAIDLLANKISNTQAHQLMSILDDSDTLTTLCGIGPDQSKLDFSYAGLGAACVVMVAHELDGHRAVTSIDISNNNLGGYYTGVPNKGSRGSEVLKFAAALKTCPLLTSIDISCNNLGAKGAAALAGVLEGMLMCSDSRAFSDNMTHHGKWVCVDQLGVGYRNSTDINDRWTAGDGPNYEVVVEATEVSDSPGWLQASIPGVGTKYLPRERGGQLLLEEVLEGDPTLCMRCGKLKAQHAHKPLALTDIDMSGNSLTKGKLRFGGDKFKEGDYDTDPTGIVMLTAAIKVSSLVTLDISNNKLDADAKRQIREAIKGHPTMREAIGVDDADVCTGPGTGAPAAPAADEIDLISDSEESGGEQTPASPDEGVPAAAGDTIDQLSDSDESTGGILVSC
jgi:hypothetical protein